MEDFTVIHLKCGKLATLVYYTEDAYYWDGKDETCEPTNKLRIDCDTCNTHIEIEPKR